tara:strand:- start:4983 stop:6251 length:1269 start_codon:yes stop_codon:yes gene_type:complete
MKVFTELSSIKKGDLNFCSLSKRFFENENLPVRFVSVKSTEDQYETEIDLVKLEGYHWGNKSDIFELQERKKENVDQFTAVLIIPTGIGCDVGGHCGDGNAVARLVASSCDTLITHPNVVNGADYNEMTDNTLYVEGSTLTRLIMGQIGLQPVRSNRLLMLVDSAPRFFNDEIINAVSTARVSLGINCEVHEMSDLPHLKISKSKSGRAIGTLHYLERLFNIVAEFESNYDAFALSTLIDEETDYYWDYYNPKKCKPSDLIANPIGGIEAMLTHTLVKKFNKPCAHAPLQKDFSPQLGVLDPRKAAESYTTKEVHCILKGLFKSPKIVDYDLGLNVEDVSCVIIPAGCLGLPVLACIEQGIPVIAVEDRNLMKNKLENLPFRKDKFFKARDYVHAVGIMQVIKNGMSLDSLLRPVDFTKILK